MYWGSRAPGLLCKGNGQCNWPIRSCLTNHWQSCRDISFHCSCLCSKYISKPMIVVKHVDSIVGSLLPIRLSTFKLVQSLECCFELKCRVRGVTIWLDFHSRPPQLRLQDHAFVGQKIAAVGSSEFSSSTLVWDQSKSRTQQCLHYACLSAAGSWLPAAQGKLTVLFCWVLTLNSLTFPRGPGPLMTSLSNKPAVRRDVGAQSLCPPPRPPPSHRLQHHAGHSGGKSSPPVGLFATTDQSLTALLIPTLTKAYPRWQAAQYLTGLTTSWWVWWEGKV